MFLMQKITSSRDAMQQNTSMIQDTRDATKQNLFSRDARKQNSCDLSAVSLPQTLITSLVNSPALQDQHKHSQ